jgi:deoxyribonuclease V
MPPPLHSWSLTAAQAVALQKELAPRVLQAPPIPTPVMPGRLIAGADVSYNRDDPVLYAAVVVLQSETLEVVEVQAASAAADFPYIPGLLSFREAPALVAAFAKLQRQPDLVMVDGQGIAHPRRLGIASHLGLWLGLPTIGCAKSLLVGKFENLAEEPGSTAPLLHRKEQIGLAVRTKRRCNPIFLSVGYRISLEDALAWTLASCRGYRLPEPTRQAHLTVNAVRRGEVKIS